MEKSNNFNTEFLQDILRKYLGSFDTDVTEFSDNITDDIREFIFTIEPNPTSAMDLDPISIKCKIVLDRKIGIYYIEIGAYKSIITEYDYKNFKDRYFARKFYNENSQKSDSNVDALINELYNKAEERRIIRRREESVEVPGPGMIGAVTNVYADDEPVYDEPTQVEYNMREELIAERANMPYDAFVDDSRSESIN